MSGVEAGVWAGVLLAEMHRNPLENIAILKKKRFRSINFFFKFASFSNLDLSGWGLNAPRARGPANL